MEQEACRIAVVGAGRLVGQSHCRLIQELSSSKACELACVCQRRAEDTEVATRFSVPLYIDAYEMARQEPLQGVVISAPTDAHLPLVRRCIEGLRRRREELGPESVALRALLVEKPLAESLEAGLELLRLAEAEGIEVLVGHQRRHSPLVQRARELVTRHDFGPLRTVSMEFCLLKPDSYFNSERPEHQWRTRKGVGGPILINLIHDLDLMRYMTGHEILRVFAATSSCARNAEVEDSGALVVTFDHGAVGSLVFSDAAPSPWSYEFTAAENKKYPPVVERDTRDCYHFAGAQRSLGFPSMRSFSYCGDRLAEGEERGWDAPLSMQKGLSEEESAGPRTDPLLVQMAHFVRLCRGQESQGPVCSGRDALESLAAAQAVLRSAATSLPVAPSDLLREAALSSAAAGTRADDEGVHSVPSLEGCPRLGGSAPKKDADLFSEPTTSAAI
eukprot:TRINITY_DN26682_c0_g2_i1.p1 TRINITY_DN26682_c0_g2~~TRINITY_DN26682_c0_g2_i1.p1  ORF type:complete len:446 (+),score=99.26 TRINITY_DN26682_c0_g2_i1:108-1445(+)